MGWCLENISFFKCRKDNFSLGRNKINKVFWLIEYAVGERHSALRKRSCRLYIYMCIYCSRTVLLHSKHHASPNPTTTPFSDLLLSLSCSHSARPAVSAQRWLTAPLKPLHIVSMVPALSSLLLFFHCCLFSTPSCVRWDSHHETRDHAAPYCVHWPLWASKKFLDQFNKRLCSLVSVCHLETHNKYSNRNSLYLSLSRKK